MLVTLRICARDVTDDVISTTVVASDAVSRHDDRSVYNTTRKLQFITHVNGDIVSYKPLICPLLS